MKKKILTLMAILMSTAHLSGCSIDFSEYCVKLDEINPAINNDFGLRVSVIDGVDNNNKFGSATGNNSNNEYFNIDNVIENGTEKTKHHKVTNDKLTSVNKNTLTSQKIKELESNGSIVNDAVASVPIVADSIAGGSYVQDYLKPYSENIISSIENKKRESESSKNTLTPKFYFNIAYSGLDIDENGKKKWVNYSNSYIPNNMDNYIYSDVITNLMQINNWYNVRADLESAYNQQKTTAQEFGDSKIKVNDVEKTVKNCTVEELVSKTTDRVNANYHSTWIMLQNYKKGKYVYTTYQEFLNSYGNKPSTAFSNAPDTSKTFTRILPLFSSSYGVNWSAHTLSDDPMDTNKVRIIPKLQLSAVNSIFRSSNNVNRDYIGTETIVYRDKNEYGGSVYYFENRNHRLVVTIYCNSFNSTGLNEDTRNFVLNLIDDLKNPSEINDSKLNTLRQIKKGL